MLDWWLPENVSTYGREIDWLFHLIYYITGVTAILVFATMLVFPGDVPRSPGSAGASTRTAIPPWRSSGRWCRR